MEIGSPPNEIRRTEGLDAHRRFKIISQKVQECLRGTAFLEDKSWTQEDVERAKQLLLACAPYAHPKVGPIYWEYIILASIYAKRLAESTRVKEFDPLESQGLLLLHDIGRLVIPHRYLLNDQIAHVLLEKKNRVRGDLLEKLTPMVGILGLPGQNPVNSLTDLTVSQRILDTADNLGKKGTDGQLFNIKTFKAYATVQPTRYTAGVWPNENIGRKRLVAGRQRLSTDLVLAQINWLRQKYGIDFNKLREEVAEEFNRSENQEFLLALKDAQETLDINVDRLLLRPPVEAIVFDMGDVLFQGKPGEALDDELIRRLCSFFNCSRDNICNAFKSLHTEGMPGIISERGYLERFWQLAGRQAPQEIDALRKPFIHPGIYRPNKKMQKIVRSLAQNTNIRLYIFSNIISPLAPIMKARLKKCYPEIPEEHMLTSCELAVAKGVNEDVYAKLVESVKPQNPEGIIFIDDNEEYSTATRVQKGIRGFTFRGNPYKNLSAEDRLLQELEKAEVI